MTQAPGEGIQLHLLQRAEPFAESTNNFRDKTRPCIAIHQHSLGIKGCSTPETCGSPPGWAPTPDVASHLFSAYAVEAS